MLEFGVHETDRAEGKWVVTEIKCRPEARVPLGLHKGKIKPVTNPGAWQKAGPLLAKLNSPGPEVGEVKENPGRKQGCAWPLLSPSHKEARRIRHNMQTTIWCQLLLWPSKRPRSFLVILLSPDTYKIINFQFALAKLIHYKGITSLWLGLRNRWSNVRFPLQTTVTAC